MTPSRTRWTALAKASPYALLAAISYLPLALTGRGYVVPDTKPYLYLDPGRLLHRALSLWDPGIGLGTVTHQTVGYLWPMGPFYWALDAAGLPDWLAQRLWFASLLFAAGTGVLFLLRTFGLRTLPALAGALPYLLTPYVIGYAGVTAILLPYAGLPWMAALVVRGLRRGGWRHAALFALVVTTVGSINATALLCAVVGSLVWVPVAVWSRREVPARRAAAVMARFGALTLVTQLWWIVALLVDGSYGSSILEVTETIRTTSATSLASEVVRGLGYWFFYGGDRLGAWVPAAEPFQVEPWLIVVGFVLPVAAIATAAFLRWSIRAYAVALVAIGMAIAVGAHPYDDPAPLGRALKGFAESSSFGLALRNSQRAVPLVVLGFAILLAGGVAALLRRSETAGRVALAVVAALAGAGNPALWNGSLIDPASRRLEDIPRYWTDAGAWLDGHDDGSGVLEIPGSDFAAYRWGTTTDPVTPGLIDRPSVSKELVPSGSPRAVDMVSALDRRLQEGIFEPKALAPMSRLMGVGEVLLRSDLEYERYRTPRPRSTWQHFLPTPAGLEDPVRFGEPVPNRAVPHLPLDDETELAVPPAVPDPPPVAVFGVTDRVPIVRAKPAAGQLVVDGDAEGLVDLAAAGILRGDELVRFASDLSDPRDIVRAPDGGGAVVVTDSNRRRARRWSTVRENFGYTEPAGFVPMEEDDPGAGIAPVPTAGAAAGSSREGDDAARTVAEYRGIAGVAATDYGNIVSYTPEHRPYRAVDGDLGTAWRVGAFSNPQGERWRLDLERPVMTDRVNLVQPLAALDNRFLTRVSLRLDGGPWRPFALSDASRSPAGQDLVFDRQPVQRIEVRVDATNVGARPVYDGLSAVGIAELRVGSVVADEVLRVPRDLLGRPDVIAGRPLWIALTRSRTDPSVVVRSDEEPSLARTFELPAARSFGVETTVRLSPLAPDELIDEVLGLPGPEAGGALARSSGRLPGDVRARASAALDGDPATAWSPGFLDQRGNWLEVTMARRVTIDRLDLQVVADGLHSTPTRLRITNEAGEARDVDLAAIEPGGRGEVAARSVAFPALVAETLRVTILDVDEDLTLDYFSSKRIVAPVAIAELGIPGLANLRPPAEVPATCHPDLVTIDGRPLDVRIVGSRSDAESRAGLRAVPCGTPSTTLEAGNHDVRTVPGDSSGIDVDRVVLASDANGAPLAANRPALAGPAGPVPRLAVSAPSRSSWRVRATGATEAFWLVLGQSQNRGWRATANGEVLPRSSTVDGFANGWLIDPGGAATIDIDLEWRPQSLARAALAASFGGALLCVALVAGSRRHRPRWRHSLRTPSAVIDDDATFGLEDAATAPRGGLALRGLALRVLVIAGVSLLVVPVPDAVAVAAAGAVVGAVSGRMRGRARAAMVVAAAVAVGVAGLYTAFLQRRYGYPSGFQWPRPFSFAHRLAWIGILVMVAESILGRRPPN